MSRRKIIKSYSKMHARITSRNFTIRNSYCEAKSSFLYLVSHCECCNRLPWLLNGDIGAVHKVRQPFFFCYFLHPLPHVCTFSYLSFRHHFVLNFWSHPYLTYFMDDPLQKTLVATALYLTRHMNMEWLTDLPEFGGSQCKNIPTIFLCQVISFAKLHNKLFTTIFVFTLK